MILQALADYYHRESKMARSNIAPFGMEKKEIKFLIEIDEDGHFVNLIDLRDDGKKGNIYLVPKTEKRSGTNSWQIANLLWDHYGYVLGQSQAGKENANASKQMESFISKIESLPEEIKAEKEIAAVRKFYESGSVSKVLEHENWLKCNKIAGCNLTFRLNTSDSPVTSNRKLQDFLSKQVVCSEGDESEVSGVCLVSGKSDQIIARTHSKVQINGNQANLVGFQKNSGYDSYGKEQGYNAPVSVESEFCYSTALKSLLDSDTNKVKLGETVLLFWAVPKTISEETAEKAEKSLYSLFASNKDNPDLGVKNVKDFFESIFKGKIPNDVGDRFYILGLKANKARISVVFWKIGTLKDIASNIYGYFEDIEITKKAEWRDLTLRDILSSSEYKNEIDNVPSNMPPALISSVLNYTPYPSALFGHIMGRVRAERNPTFPRVAFIKAYLNRKAYLDRKNKKEGVVLKVPLDRNNTNPAYRLGRLFAVLEEVQRRAYYPNVPNSTIRDRFYSAASSSPISVFSTLMRLKNHHLEKLDNGSKYFFEKEITDIFSALSPDTIPMHLSLEEQGYFAVGYYHERGALFNKENN